MHCLLGLWKTIVDPSSENSTFLWNQVRVRGKYLAINTELTVETTLVPIVWHCAEGA